MHRHRPLSILIAVIALVTLSPGSVSAAPTHSPNANWFTLACDSGQTYLVAANGAGDFTPGHIVEGGDGVIVLVAIAFTVTDPTGNVVFSDVAARFGQMAGLAADLMDCTFSATFDAGGQTFTVDGALTGFLTPRSSAR